MIQRDAAFWDAVANHEEVAPKVFMGLEPVSLLPLVEDVRSFPLASEHGGFIFSPLDPHGFLYELHTLYTPEGWGREVNRHAKASLRLIMATASVIVTHEQEGEAMTRPPLSFGWRACGDFKEVGLPKRLRMWVLTAISWAASPVGRKLCLS